MVIVLMHYELQNTYIFVFVLEKGRFQMRVEMNGEKGIKFLIDLTLSFLALIQMIYME